MLIDSQLNEMYYLVNDIYYLINSILYETKRAETTIEKNR